MAEQTKEQNPSRSVEILTKWRSEMEDRRKDKDDAGFASMFPKFLQSIDDHVSALTDALDAIDQNRSRDETIERLQAKADAFDNLVSLISEGYHSFKWDYDADAEILTLTCYDNTVQLGYPDNVDGGTEKTLAAMLKTVRVPSC